MKWLIFTILLFLLTACQTTSAGFPRTETAYRTTSSAGEKPTPTPPAPLYIPAVCALMGSEVRREVPAGHPVILVWGWSAATVEQVEDFVDAAAVTVTFDGRTLIGTRLGETPLDTATGRYQAVWGGEAGTPSPGSHTVTYTAVFRRMIFDGVAYFGPGTKNVALHDQCELVVVN